MSNLVIQGQTWATIKEQSAILVNSGFLPSSIKLPEQAMAIAIKGHEIGLPIMQSFAQISIIQGKPTLNAEGQLALIYKNCPGAIVNFIVLSNEECVIEAKRPGGKANTFRFTIEDARLAGLLGKDNWRKYPRAMLRSRCISEMARSLFPDAIAGMSYTPEELGAEVDEDGEIIEIKIEENKSQEKKEEAPKAKTTGKTKSPFNSALGHHVKVIKDLLIKKEILDVAEQDDIMELMEGKFASDLDAVIKLHNEQKLDALEKELAEEEKLPNPNQKNVDDVLAVIEEKLKKKSNSSHVF